MKSYKIEYNNNFIQFKILIPHKDYLCLIKPLIKIKNELEDRKLNTNLIDNQLKKLTKGKEWFTDESPLYKAIKTGYLEPSFIGGNRSKIKITLYE